MLFGLYLVSSSRSGRSVLIVVRRIFVRIRFFWVFVLWCIWVIFWFVFVLFINYIFVNFVLLLCCWLLLCCCELCSRRSRVSGLNRFVARCVFLCLCVFFVFVCIFFGMGVVEGLFFIGVVWFLFCFLFGLFIVCCWLCVDVFFWDFFLCVVCVLFECVCVFVCVDVMIGVLLMCVDLRCCVVWVLCGCLMIGWVVKCCVGELLC